VSKVDENPILAVDVMAFDVCADVPASEMSRKTGKLGTCAGYSATGTLDGSIELRHESHSFQ